MPNCFNFKLIMKSFINVTKKKQNLIVTVAALTNTVVTTSNPSARVENTKTI